MTEKKPLVSEHQPKKFGTFGGVFTPSVLTILGVIMFLRYAQVVGYAGLWGSLLILLCAKAITTITGLSIASIATNMQVRGGGAYFLISRSLGVEFGGVIAVFFYVAQAVAVTLYVMGFTEAIFSAFPTIGQSFLAVATLTNMAVFVCVYIGAGWTIRIQYAILAILLISIGSFFAGAVAGFSYETLRANLSPNWTEEQSVFTVFALFFPAVTGIMAGVNMSGDLKNPSRSLPDGTFAAIGVTSMIYAYIAILLAASRSRSILVGPDFVMKDIAWSAPLIYAGVIAATLSSALGSMMGAPRILQAFARDNVFSWLKWFGYGSEPRRAIVLTFLISQLGIMVGDLNSIAPVITMFFLMTYGTVNLACFYEAITRNPSYRPTFRIHHWSIALIGALGCLVVMLLINTAWAIVALIMAGVLYGLIVRTEIIVQWGDLGSGLAFQQARNALLRLERERYHPKNWRPIILALSGAAWSRFHIAQYACWLAAGRGIVTLGQVIQGDLEDRIVRRVHAEQLLRKFIRENALPAFPVVLVEENIGEGVRALLQCHGIGGLRPNTVLMGWSEDPARIEMFSEVICLSQALQRSLIIVRCEEDRDSFSIPSGAINIWWTDPQNGALMLLLAFLLRQNRQWRHHSLRILRPVPLKADVENVIHEMTELLSISRITAEIVVLPTEDPLKAIGQAMHPSAVLFAGFEPSADNSPECRISDLNETMALPGDVIMVYNAGDASLMA